MELTIALFYFTFEKSLTLEIVLSLTTHNVLSTRGEISLNYSGGALKIACKLNDLNKRILS